jgi:hypothetical protein
MGLFELARFAAVNALRLLIAYVSGFPFPPSLQGAEGLLPLVRLYTQHIADL